jgi:hypothetical protein
MKGGGHGDGMNLPADLHSGDPLMMRVTDFMISGFPVSLLFNRSESMATWFDMESPAVDEYVG